MPDKRLVWKLKEDVDVEKLPTISLRDWFAGMAMQGIMSGTLMPAYQDIAIAAYKEADAMIIARNQ